MRQSLDRAEGIQNQLQRCTGLANAKGWPVVATFSDNEVRASGVRGVGTGWHAMLGRVGRDFEVIVAVDLDRLVRSTKDLNKLIDLGAQVVTVDGEIDLTSADGEFRATMIAGIGRFETRRASERQKRHKAAKAERGEWHGGHAPYGYRVEDHRLVPEPSEVQRIEEATHRLLELGEPVHSIIMDWNNRGIQTRAGKHWRHTNLRSILLNRSMLGETVAGVVGWAPIIDLETFDRITAYFTDPSRKIVHSPGVLGGKYSMGGGLSVCAKCGKPLVSHRKPGKTKRTVLSCLARVQGPSPSHPRIEREVTRNGQKLRLLQDSGRVVVGHDALESYVFERAIARLYDTEYWQKRKSEQDPHAEEKIAALNAQRERLAERRARAVAMFLDGDITRSERRDLLNAIEAEADQIGREIQSLVGTAEIESALGDREQVLAAWQEWTMGQRRAFLRLLIDRVVVDEWPAGYSRGRRQLIGESDDQYAAAKVELGRRGLERRVTIEWRE